ncbi:hypothetical protein HPB50_010461 [Hyalomma asiaticum]|uniref:Uncharacterized protein n=1 Tax=Hyalomma asiaticum TaxID=266040 RepID=A0ACB7THT5_HYAAI|nr:hypothetical protein HPB50_010461 [Hyalomma asiaticum]
MEKSRLTSDACVLVWFGKKAWKPYTESNEAILKAFRSSYGFSQKLLECVKENVKGMNEMQWHGELVIDEMKLSTHLDLKSSLEIEGFVNLGQFTDERDRHSKAHHGLVVMFKPFIGKWT